MKWDQVCKCLSNFYAHHRGAHAGFHGRPIMPRSFSSVDSSTSNAFDRDLKQKQRDNAARSHKAWLDGEDAVDYNYFRQELAYRLVDRLDDIKREEGFPLALDIGMYNPKITSALFSTFGLLNNITRRFSILRCGSRISLQSNLFR